jgi:pentatricopeptide repeat protein
MDADIEVREFENLGWWKYQMSELDTLSIGKEKFARDMAYRTKGYVKYLVDSYKSELLKEEENLEENLFLNILSTIVDKKDFESYRKVISLCAQDQDYETALFYLERMLKNGYKDLNALYTIEGTLALRMSKNYNKLIKKHLGTSKYFFSN